METNTRLETAGPVRAALHSAGHYPASPRLRLFLTAACVLLLLLGGLCAAQLIQARQHLSRGVVSVQAVRLGSPVQLRRASLRYLALSRLRIAQREFAAARDDLWLWSPLLGHLGWVPVVGPQLAAAPPAVDASYYTVSSALYLLDGLQPLVSDLGDNGALGPRLARDLEGGHRALAQARVDADRAASALARLPRRTGNDTLDRGAARLRRDLPALRASATWLALAPVILGDQRSSTYLVTFQDSHELRATGGFIAAADFVTLHDGAMSTSFSGSALPRETTAVFPPLPEAYYTPETRWIFRDSNWSPDFPLSARLERWFYGEDTGRWAQGVIDIDQAAVSDLLRATGPLYVPQYRLWVNASNMEALTQLYVNGVYKGPLRTGPHDTVRKQFLGDVIAAVLRKAQRLPPAEWTRLGSAVAQAVSRRDLLLYDRRPDVEMAIKRIGAEGSIRRVPGDYLYVVDDNRSYNKLNPYVREWGSYQASIRPDLWIDATLTLHYYVSPSPADLEGFGPGYGMWGSKHDYQDFVRIYVPAGSMLRSMSGLDAWVPARAYGLVQFSGRLLVREGQTSTVTVRYSVPANVLSPFHFRRYRLTVQHQPAGNLEALKVTLAGTRASSVGPRTAAPASADAWRLNLQRDASVSATIEGARHQRTVPIPPAPAHPDPYIPFASVHDARHPL